MGGRSAPTVCPIRTSRPSWHCRLPGTRSWTAALDMASPSPQTHPCWSGTSPQVHRPCSGCELALPNCHLLYAIFAACSKHIYTLPLALYLSHTHITRTHTFLAFRPRGTVPEKPRKQQSHLLILSKFNHFSFMQLWWGIERLIKRDRVQGGERERCWSITLCLSCKISW